MGDLVRAIVEVFHFFWPFVIVEPWESGGYFCCGRLWREVGPGLKMTIPWFTHVTVVDTRSALCGTGREDISLKDGSTLSFQAMATIHVVEPMKALLAIDDYHASTQELVGSFLAEKLAEVEPDRLTPEKRGRYFKQLAKELAAEAAEFGVEVTKLRFTSFVLNVRTVRLLMDQGAASPW